ncbi:alpha/beta hydrolase family protein [Porticoccaceae bacterium nBUS_09]
MNKKFSANLFCVVSILLFTFPGCGGGGGGSDPAVPQSPQPSTSAPTTQPSTQAVNIASLDELSVPSLRARSYTSSLSVEESIQSQCTADGNPPPDGLEYDSYMLAYSSDGLNVFTRMDIPAAPAASGGYPVVIFAHGYVGLSQASQYGFSCGPGSMYTRYIDAMAQAGFVVLTPGFRGHGTVNGTVADGREFLEAWDNGSYISPSFYAIDVLNLLAALPADQGLSVTSADGTSSRMIQTDSTRVFLAGHSQGGDAILTVLAAVGEGAASGLSVSGASIWSGTFPDRFTQLRSYHAMATSPEAFLSGDGTWTGSAESSDGQVNTNFVFGYPPEWIENPDPPAWTWQSDTWYSNSVKAAVVVKLDQMYSAINDNVDDISDASYQINDLADGSFEVTHDLLIESGLAEIGGYGPNQWMYITELLNLHFSNRDYYSWPVWNETLCDEAARNGSDCHSFLYGGNTHSLGISDRVWFSGPSDVAGYDYMIERDIDLFSGDDPNLVPYP